MIAARTAAIILKLSIPPQATSRAAQYHNARSAATRAQLARPHRLQAVLLATAARGRLLRAWWPRTAAAQPATMTTTQLKSSVSRAPTLDAQRAPTAAATATAASARLCRLQPVRAS